LYLFPAESEVVSDQIADGAALLNQDLVALRASLREQRLFRLEQLKQFSGPAARADCAREKRAASQLEVHVELAASARMVLADVEAALERMDQGQYGSCHRCRRPIAVQRLRIVPQARYCGRCHQSREADR
jgi:DnaK suppressor protein